MLYRILQAPSNNISKILLSNQTISNLNEVNLSKNPISEWSDVLNLSDLLPNLEILALNECSIKYIEFPHTVFIDGEEVKEEKFWFPKLRMLQLSSCKIDNWASVEALNAIPNMVHFKFKDNPILEKESRETCRQLLIAAIKSLAYLNGSSIEKQERRGAEIDFLKKYGKEYLSLQESNDEKQMIAFINAHPR